MAQQKKRKPPTTISFQADDETIALLRVVEETIDALPQVRRSAAIRKAIKIAAAQLDAQGGGK